MYSLLNRITWIVSLIFGQFAALYMVGYQYEGFVLWIGFFIGFIFKKIIFSANGIDNSLTEIRSSIEKVASQSTPTVQESRGERSYTASIINTSKSTLDITSISDIETHREDIQREDVNIASQKNDASQSTLIPEEPSKITLYIHSFFLDRPLAKVGGILLFLGALFFLWLVFAAVGPVGKTFIGLVFGFTLIALGAILDNKGIIVESRILFGVGIAVNYLTILSGRHLLGSDIGDGVLFSESITTVALLLNTGLAITISLVYRSRVLLGFAFIFAYLTPFLVGSTSSSLYLLVIYTTILTIAISFINDIYTRLAQSDNVEYLQGIATVGMTLLLSLATVDANGSSMLAICVGLFVSIASLAISSYRARISPIPILIGGYIVLFASTFVVSSYFIVPLSIIMLLALGIWFALQSIISVIFMVIFGCIAFAMSLIGFVADGGQSIGILFTTGLMIFALLGVLIIHSASIILGSAALIGFSVLTLIGITIADPVYIDLTAVMSTRAMSIALLVGASIFTIRLRDGLYFLMAIILSGILMIYPDTFAMSLSLTTIALSIYLIISFVVPYILIQDAMTISRRVALLVSLPVSALVITTAIYQVGRIEFPGLAMGVAYIIQAVVYLIYSMVLSSRILPAGGADITALPATQKTDLLVLFSLPLSLFTLALAFVFGDLPGMMSLAWILESTILYLVYTRLGDLRIYIAACLVFLIGIVRQTVLLGSIMQSDYLTLAILTIAMISVFVSLYLLRSERHHSRMIHDVLHIMAILGIGYGISRIVPVTTYGWSLLGISAFILILANLYRSFGQLVHRQFLSVVFILFCFFFLSRFDTLNKIDPIPLIIQFSTIGMILAIGYNGYRSRDTLGYIDLAVSLIAALLISSFYVNYFFGVFAVSIYLTIIAAILIIKGISNNQPLLRTVGLYVGTFVLAKILFYDLWQDDLGAIVRVFALMISGGVMMYLSQLYGKYVSRSWQEEFSFENIFQIVGVEKETPKDIIDNTPDINPFTGELGIELSKIDVSQIGAVEFISNSTSFTIKRLGLIRLARYITDSLHKTEFTPGELTSAHAYVLGYLESNLPARELQSILTKLERWIQEGGSVKFINK